ncbi:MAG TPA: hypothetical protein DDW49_02105 [Deltaproteobacteria bacterium]|nr:MAG: hypothetical protein A2048_11075 [Deltaproteobacteria bacterium GWA2_45_12]HBF12178.1 hypothetical protein [Deltaproteobacteria bacterium]
MLEEFATLMDYCTYCPRLCQSACPVLTVGGNESHSPWGLMQTMNLLRKGEISLDSEVAALSYQCLTCRACTTLCEHLNVIPPVLHEVRKEAAKKDLAPAEIMGFLAKFHKHGNPFSKDLLTTLKQIVPAKYFEAGNPIVYLASCTTIAKAPEVIRDTFELFEKLGIDNVGIYPETMQCCGFPLISAGMEEEFVDVAELNFHALKKFKTIISGSPSCVYTLKETYKEYDFNLQPKVVTINEFLEPHLKKNKLVFKKNKAREVMFHDPCYRSRYLGEIELPRELMGMVHKEPLKEFFHHGEKSGCSGQGGCFSVVSQDVSNQIAKVRLDEVYEKGADTLVTQCPSCIHKFRKNDHGHLAVMDLVSFLNSAIQGVAPHK